MAQAAEIIIKEEINKFCDSLRNLHEKHLEMATRHKTDAEDLCNLVKNYNLISEEEQQSYEAYTNSSRYARERLHVEFKNKYFIKSFMLSDIHSRIDNFSMMLKTMSVHIDACEKHYKIIEEELLHQSFKSLWQDPNNSLVNGNVQQRSLNSFLGEASDILPEMTRIYSTSKQYFLLISTYNINSYLDFKNSLIYPLELRESVKVFLASTS